jgi:putative integral membrane protein (TIGR02587 family)
LGWYINRDKGHPEKRQENKFLYRPTKRFDMVDFMKDLGFKQEKKDLLRGTAGAMILGIPLIYTMEMWDLGITLSSLQLLSVFVLMFMINILFSYFSGLRESHSSEKFGNAMEDAITSMALSLILAAIVLLLLGKINAQTHFWYGSMGEIIIQGSTMSLGVTFTNMKFNQKDNRSLSLTNPTLLFQPSKRQLHRDLNELAATIAGATVFAFNVAPTEEIVLIASGMSSLQLLILIFAEMLMGYIILFASGILETKVYEKQSFFQKPWVEVILAYTVSFIISFCLLMTVGGEAAHASLDITIASTIVLAFPAIIGGSAGRIII